MSGEILNAKRAERKARAQTLLAGGAVHPNGQPGSFLVASQSGAGVYIVNLLANTCTCQDLWGRLFLGACKHIEAARLFERRRLQAEGHTLGEPQFYCLAEGWDVEARCSCGEPCSGFAATSQADAYEELVCAWQEHVRIVGEHAGRSPGDGWR